MRNIKKSLLKTFVVLILVLSMPFSAFAHEANFIAVTVDEYTNLYSSTVITSNEFLLSSHPEIQSSIATRQIYETGDTADKAQSIIGNMQTFKSNIAKAPLTFPANGALQREDLNQNDINQSHLINNILIPSLNSALLFINDGKAFESLDELATASQNLLNVIDSGGTIGDASISKGKSARIELDSEGLSDNCYITISKNGKSQSFVCRMPKNSSYDGDVKSIGWTSCVKEAWSHYLSGYTTMNAGDMTQPGVLEEAVTGLLNSVGSWIASSFGLFTIDDLVFNGGIRGTTLYFHGILPSGWVPGMNTLYMLSLIVAMISFLLSIISIVVRSNFSMLSGQMRVNVMKDIQNLILAGLLTAFCFPVIGIFLNLGDMIVNIFANFVDPNIRGTFLGTLATQGNFIAGAIAEIALVIITLMLNVTYIIRGVLTAALIVLAPLAIWTLTLGENSGKIFTQWLKILASTIMIQPIHALVLGLLLTVPFNTVRGIEGLVYCASLIPVSAAIGKLIFRDAGDALSSASRMTSGSITGAVGLGFLASRGVRNVRNDVIRNQQRKISNERYTDSKQREHQSDINSQRNYNSRIHGINSTNVQRRTVKDPSGSTIRTPEGRPESTRVATPFSNKGGANLKTKYSHKGMPSLRDNTVGQNHYRSKMDNRFQTILDRQAMAQANKTAHSQNRTNNYNKFKS